MNNANQSAFPIVCGDQSNPDDRGISEGLTKREYFAAMAMQGLIGAKLKSYDNGTQFNKQNLANMAVELADELLKQLEK